MCAVALLLNGCATVGRPPEASVDIRCILTPVGTMARCQPSDATVPDLGWLMTNIYVSRMLRDSGRRPPGWMTYTFHIRLQKPGASDGTRRPEPVGMNFDTSYRKASDAERVELEVLRVSDFLCRHQQLDAPALSRLPKGMDLSRILRPEDLRYLQEHPSTEPPSELDRLDLSEDLAHSVSCALKDIQVEGNTARVRLQPFSPPWAELDAARIVAEAEPYGDERDIARLKLIARWVGQHPPRSDGPERTLAFVNTPHGWRVDYQLPERASPAAP